MGLPTHIWRSHGKGINHNPNVGYEKGIRIVWNKGLTKETNSKVRQIAQTKRGKSIQIKKPWKMSEENRQKLSLRQSISNSGGKCKWFNVGGIKVQGTWERDFAYKLNENNILWSRGTPFLYKINGKERRYTPDFYLKEHDIFIEIKGFWWGNDKEKMIAVLKQNPILKNHLVIIESALFQTIIKNNDRFIECLSSLIGKTSV